MAKARRTTARSSGRRRKGRSALWLIFGLTLGAGLMYASQVYLHKDRRPFAGLANLFRATTPSERPPTTDTKPEPAEPAAKPKFDFYTILPGETVLPEPRAGGGTKTTKVEPPEKGVSYLLQAAAYGNLEDADRLKARLAINGLDSHIERISAGDKGTYYYRVRLGPFSSLDTLDATHAKLGKLGIKAIRIQVKKGAG
jgi:cell division protein FtsN